MGFLGGVDGGGVVEIGLRYEVSHLSQVGELIFLWKRLGGERG